MVSKRKGRARLGNEAPVCEQQEHLDEKRSAMATRYDRLDAVYIMQSTPRLCWLCSARKEETSRSDTRLEQTCRCVIFFFRLLIVLFIIIIITHQSVENERLKKKKGKARDELTPLVTPYQCTVAHVRENTWTWPPLRGCRCGSVCACAFERNGANGCVCVVVGELAPLIITAANCTRGHWLCETERGCSFSFSSRDSSIYDNSI